MHEFIEGVGFYIRIVLLLFTWLMVAVFVSPQLASIMGLVVIGLAVFVFIPLNYLREMVWQKRQKAIMAQMLEYSPQRAEDYQYAPGSALPPPDKRGDIVLSEQQGGAVDLYRELPQLPPLEPRNHAQSFKRTLVLPIVGLLMFVGAENDLFMHHVLEGQGMAVKPPIAFDKIAIPAVVKDDFADKSSEIDAVARMVLSRVGACREITGGQVEPVSQLASAQDKLKELQEGRYVYVLNCRPASSKESPFSVWVSPDDLDVGRISSLMRSMDKPVSEDVARDKCFDAGNVLVQSMKGRILKNPDVNSVLLYDQSRAPYSGYAYVISREKFVVLGTAAARNIVLSCWISPDGGAVVRFVK